MKDKYKKLLSQFADSLIAQNVAIGKHDPKTGNKFARKYIKAADALLKSDSEGIEAFTALLKDERTEVRAMAASYLLPYRMEESLLVLREAAKGEGITALGAFMTLKRWEEGGSRQNK